MDSNRVFQRRIVKAADAPGPIGPYSPAVIIDNTMYLSGAVGIDPATGELAPGGIGPQTEQAMKNIGAILKAAGIDFNNVVKSTVLLEDVSDWPAMNAVYQKFFKSHFPARAAYAVKELPKKGVKVEIEMVAIVGKIVDQENKL